MDKELKRQNARINAQGELVGNPTPSQRETYKSNVFQVALGLYRVALANGHQTARNRLDLLNSQLNKVADTATSLTPSLKF